MNDFSSYGFYPSTTGTYWYQSGCFECSSDDTALDLDFTYADISDWTLTSDDANAFHMDLQTSDGKPSLRILEIYPKGKATIDYLSTFNVEAEATYELVFDVRSSLPVNQHTGLPDTDFSLLTFYITTNGNIIHETIPVNGVWDRGQGWLKFTSHFVVRKEDAGAAKLSFTLHASGVHLDWYLSYLWVRKV
ncbi:hypothetical protein G7Z17_g11977 [Cylindrodendrum hubeiense]|uniref:Uncharacterized protein n=1 Tax=Cylindrodendrum hubeiense TaxID=595255 RepID=A0A9P5GYI6_9HYPO|nr:hypothetical protein G7Z17_g11977 [Cylindrodendrum hubeiense]